MTTIDTTREAGRAGRNRLPAYVASVFSEEDIDSSNYLLVGDEKNLREYKIY